MIPPGFVAHCGYCGYCGRPLQTMIPASGCTCGSTPAQPAPEAASASAGRYVVRGGYEVCVVCGFAKEYCRGHREADPPAADGADSDLARRIAEARAKAGGR